MSEYKEVYFLPDDARERLKEIVTLKHKLAQKRAEFLRDLGMELVTTSNNLTNMLVEVVFSLES